MPKRILSGKIVSSKMQKTVVVAVSSFKAHPKYKKIMKITKKYKAHYEGEPLNVGSKVLIEETKPVSKDKKWIIKEKIPSTKSQTPNPDSRTSLCSVHYGAGKSQ